MASVTRSKALYLPPAPRPPFKTGRPAASSGFSLSPSSQSLSSACGSLRSMLIVTSATPSRSLSSSECSPLPSPILPVSFLTAGYTASTPWPASSTAFACGITGRGQALASSASPPGRLSCSAASSSFAWRPPSQTESSSALAFCLCRGPVRRAHSTSPVEGNDQ
jgi:hypothetical protein